MDNYKLEDAQAMSIVNNKTFEIPSNEQISNLKLGDFVKVCASGERFWIKLEFIDVQNRKFYGSVDNELVNTDEHGLKLGSSIELEPQNIYQIHV